jgi:hypothetical protein
VAPAVGAACFRFVSMIPTSRPWRLAVLLCVLFSPLTAARLTLKWEDNSHDEDGFRIERALSAGAFMTIAKVPPNTTSYVDSGLLAGKTYRYRVSAYNRSGSSAHSNVASALTPVANTPPQIEVIPDMVLEGEAGTVDLHVSDAESPAAQLRVVATSLNPLVMPTRNLQLTGSGPIRRLTLRPRGPGRSRVIVAVSDGQRVSYRSFQVTVVRGRGPILGSDYGETARGLEWEAQPTRPGRLVNLSARAVTGAAPQTLILGFATAGDDASILVRAVGPTLRQFGVQRVIDDPILSLHGSGGEVANNADWGGTAALARAFVRSGAFPLPSLSRDAALQLTLPPGGYSAHVQGAGDEYGIVLAEIYDADTQGAGRLVNVSARGWVGAGEGAMHLGFSIGGEEPLPVLVRAVGGGLEALGVSNLLSAPSLTLYRGEEVLARSQGWNLDLAVIEAGDAVGAFPLVEAEDTAVVATLAPGNYTVVVKGANGASGVVLAEVYELPREAPVVPSELEE